MASFKNVHPNKAAHWPIWFLAVTVLLLGGAVYRIAESRLYPIVEKPINLPVPLKAFPFTIGSWTGSDVAVTEAVRRFAGIDDFVNRLYINKATKQRVNVYVAYTARPRTMLGHRPEACYVGGGWICDGSEQAQVISSAGLTIPCFVHRFHKPVPQRDEIVVLNFYIVNGEVTNDESVFLGIAWRRPNIVGNPARYVAQVQISSTLENSTRTAARDMTDLILAFLPDKNGRVR